MIIEIPVILIIDIKRKDLDKINKEYSYIGAYIDQGIEEGLSPHLDVKASSGTYKILKE